ncbi:MAG: hypothetical protein WBW89_13450 [Candidatus Cybelea sp.]
MAIVAAGIWAFYVFAYENRIKPSLGNPEVAFSATMSKVSEHNGMIGIQLNTEMRNVGSVKAHFLGYVIWVSGRKIRPSNHIRVPTTTKNILSLDGAFYSQSRRTAVYGYGYLTNLADTTTTADLLLEPGDDEKNQDVFYIPKGKFDLLEAYLLARYTKHDEAVTPTKLEFAKDALPTFAGSRDNNFDYDNVISKISVD